MLFLNKMLYLNQNYYYKNLFHVVHEMLNNKIDMLISTNIDLNNLDKLHDINEHFLLYLDYILEILLNKQIFSMHHDIQEVMFHLNIQIKVTLEEIILNLNIFVEYLHLLLYNHFLNNYFFFIFFLKKLGIIIFILQCFISTH